MAGGMTGWVVATRQVIVCLVAFAVAGALAGVIWELVWDAPDGIVFDGTWYLEPGGPDYAFSGTGWYVVVALVVGALTAGALGWLLPRHEIATLAAIAVGSTLAGRIMVAVGHALGPQDPQVLAAGQEDFSTLPSDLMVIGAGEQSPLLAFDSSAFVAFPVGAVAAAACIFLLTSGRGTRVHSSSHKMGVGTPSAR